MSEEISAPKKILVCVDGSEISERAANFGIALAQKLQSKVYFVNVVGAEISERNYSIPAEMVGSFETIGIEALSKCEKKANEKSLQFETEQLSGDPVEEILRFSKERNCDCIVMGTRGFGKLERLFLGSVSEAVLNQSDVPVVVVR